MKFLIRADLFFISCGKPAPPSRVIPDVESDGAGVACRTPQAKQPS